MLKNGTLASPAMPLASSVLPVPGGADQQQAARNAPAELLELLRVLQEVDDFLDLFLGLVAAGDVGKGDLVGAFVQHAGLALAEAEGAALAAALHLAHEIDPYADQQQHRAPADQQGHEQRALFAWLDVKFDAVVDQVADQAPVQVGGRGANPPVIRHGRHNLGAALPFLDRGRLDPAGANLLQEIRIAHVGRTGPATGVKLLENSKQHHGNHEPDGNFREPLIIQARLQSQILHAVAVSEGHFRRFKQSNRCFSRLRPQAPQGIGTARACLALDLGQFWPARFKP
jgi:hypothetical protein